MANRWGNNENNARFIFLGSKITADGDCSHEIKRCLFLGSKAMTNLDSILKSRDNTLPTKVWLAKAMVFPVFMYGCESWTIKNAEHLRIDAFELWCWRRLLRVPWTARRSNQSILKEISSEYSLEGLMLKLKLQYFGHLMWRTNSLEKTWCWERLKAGREGDNRGWDGWMASLIQWSWVWINSGSWWWTERPGMLQSMELQRIVHDWVTGLNWTELDHSLPGSSVHGILQARVLEWVAMPFSRGASWPRYQTAFSCVFAGRFFTPELPEKSRYSYT